MTMLRVKRVWIFANPIAGHGAAVGIARALASRLEREGFAATMLTDRPDSIADDRLAESADAAMVIGGDGTLRAVARRLHDQQPMATAGLLPIPLGTANLMAQHLGIRRRRNDRFDWVIAALRRMRVRRLDALRANGDLCLLMAHVGYDAQVVHELDKGRSGPISLASYVLPAITALARCRFPKIVVQVDGREIFSGRGMALIANIPEYGLGFPLVPRTISDDGLLDVRCVPCSSRRDVVDLFLRAAARTHSHRDIQVTGRRVRVLAAAGEKQAPIQTDGDPAGFTPLEVSILPAHIPFIIP